MAAAALAPGRTPAGLGLVAARYTSSELLRGLSRVLDSSEVLIGIDDPAIYNATTIKSLLLTSYNRTGC